MNHSFGPSDRCVICDVRWHQQHMYECPPRMKGTTMETEQPRQHRRNEDIIRDFETTRPQHGGVINSAARHIGVTEASLQRALYRAKKNGWTGHFTTSHKKAQFSAPVSNPQPDTSNVSTVPGYQESHS